MKKIILFAVFGVLFAPLAFAQDADQTLEFHPSAWRKPVSRMMPMKPTKPEMPSVSSEATESVVPETSTGTSFSEADMESLKRQLEEIEQKMQALRAEKEAVMQKMKGMRPAFREMKKEMKKEMREEKKEMREEKREMKEENSGGDVEDSMMREGEDMMPPAPAEMPVMENKPMEMKTPRMGFTPFQWKKDAKKALSVTPGFKVEPKMLQQSLIRPPLSEDQDEARHRQADAKERMMKLRRVFE